MALGEKIINERIKQQLITYGIGSVWFFGGLAYVIATKSRILWDELTSTISIWDEDKQVYVKIYQHFRFIRVKE